MIAESDHPRRRGAGSLRRELWNLPNMLTLGRVLIIPPFVLYTYYADPLHSFLAAAIFALAAAAFSLTIHDGDAAATIVRRVRRPAAVRRQQIPVPEGSPA